MKTKKEEQKTTPIKIWNGKGTMPKDFWNYRINPITGHYVDPVRNEKGLAVQKKYAHMQQPNPKISK
tara:strand:+ start:2455 stop:2655 length:201 start_codon:yes stop_codon:yes gene_type:complete